MVFDDKRFLDKLFDYSRKVIDIMEELCEAEKKIKAVVLDAPILVKRGLSIFVTRSGQYSQT